MATAQALREKLGVTTSDVLVDYLNLLLYGDPGIGKTWLAATAHLHPELCPMIIFDVEGGSVTIKKQWGDQVNCGKGIDIIPVRSMKELESKLSEVSENNNGYYKCCGIDNMTELQKLDLRVIMDQAYGRNPDKVDKDVPGQREWGITLNHMRAITRFVRDLPMHTILTAHAYPESRDGENIVRIFPDISGKGRVQIPGFMDVVGYYYMGRDGNNWVRRMQFAKTERVMAKDRTNSLGDFVDNPDIPTLWEKMKAADTGERKAA